MAPRAWLKRIGIALLPVLAGYVAINVALITFAPILHRVTLYVEVVSGEELEPVAGASVVWMRGGDPDTSVGGTTDAHGRVNLSRTLQAQPIWFRPVVGRIDLSADSLQAGHAGFHGAILSLADALPSVSCSEPRGTLRIALAPE